MILKAGTYRFNDELFSFPPITDTDNRINYYFDFVVPDGDTTNNYIGISYYLYRNNYYVIYLFGTLHDDFDIAYYNGTWEFGQTMSLTTDVSVDDTFGTWFISSTNYNEVNAKPLAEITYNGETIAQLNAGETCTLKCAGLPMETDIIVKVNG